MAPIVVGDGSYKLFFFSREEPRMPIHVAHPLGGGQVLVATESDAGQPHRPVQAGTGLR